MTAFLVYLALGGTCALALAILYKLSPPAPKRRYFVGVDPAKPPHRQDTIVRGYTEDGIIHIERIDP